MFPVLAVTLIVSLTACGTIPGSTAVGGRTPGGSASGPATRAVPPARVFGRVFHNPGVTVTGGRLYVTWQANPLAAAVPRFELARVDQATGAIKAAHLLAPGQAGVRSPPAWRPTRAGPSWWPARRAMAASGGCSDATR